MRLVESGAAVLLCVSFAALAQEPEVPRSLPVRTAPESHLNGVRFTEVGEAAGLDLIVTFGSPRKRYIVERPGTGVAFFDSDGDGDADLYLVNGLTYDQIGRPDAPSNALYRNNGDGTFTDVTLTSGLRESRWGAGAAAADYDNDGDQDLYVTNFGTNALYRNNGDGTFTDVAEKAGVAHDRWSSGVVWLDYDQDGNLDLYVTNHVEFDHRNPPKVEKKCIWRGFDVGCGPLVYTPLPHILYRNNGDGTFTDVSAAAGMAASPSYGFGAAAGDFDNDGDPDIYVANDSVTNFLWRNNGDGTFTDVGLEAGVAYNEEGREQAGMGVDFGDFNNDGLWDLFVTNFSEDSNTLYRNEGRLFFTDITYTANLGEDSVPFLGWFCKFFDFDNDGDQDLVIANGHVWPQADKFSSTQGYAQEPLLYANRGDGRFHNVSLAAGEIFSRKAVSRGGAIADYDLDGDLDVVITNIEERPWLLRNDGGDRLSWIRFKLQGTRSNRDGIGARIIVRAGGSVQQFEIRSGDGYISSSDPAAHFGLGVAERADRVEVRWPSGRVDVLKNLPARIVYTVREGEGVTERRSLVPAGGTAARTRP